MIEYTSFKQLDEDNPYYNLKKNNYETVKRNYLKRSVDMLAHPIKITCQTTEACNLSCIMCAINRKVDGTRHMEWGLFTNFTEEIFPFLIEFHPTNIGEPLCSPWFEKMCSRLKYYGVLLDLTTNGTLLNPSISELIIPLLTDIKISFDGAIKETFEEIRRGGSYELTKNNIIDLVNIRDKMDPSNHPKITLQMTIMKRNVYELPQIIDLASEMNVDRVKAYHLFSFSEEMDEEIAIENEYREIYSESISMGKKRGIELEIAEYPAEGKNYELIDRLCPLLWSESFIDVNGDVYPCHSHDGYNIGNISKQSFMKIWTSKRYQELRKAIVNNSPIWNCKGCGMNKERLDKDQPVPYDIENFRSNRSYSDSNIRWSSRMKQFDLTRRHLNDQ